jgi:hypothetical protein
MSISVGKDVGEVPILSREYPQIYRRKYGVYRDLKPHPI